MNPVKNIFPQYSAAAAQMGVHGAEAASFAKAAYQAPDAASRLDQAWRSYDSFDHAVVASEQLPLHRFIPGVAGYRVGYEAAKTAAHLLISSGTVPGARERVGRQELIAAHEALLRGVEQASSGETQLEASAAASRYDRYRALDYLSASLDDATTGLVMLRKATVALPLLRGLNAVRDSVARNVTVDPANVDALSQLFAKASGELDSLIAQAERTTPVGELTPKQQAAVSEAQTLLARAAGFDPNAAPQLETATPAA